MAEQDNWTESVTRAMRVLNEIDPATLGPGEPDGPPDNEYMSEALSLINILVDSDDLADAEVRALFDRQFWPGLLNDAQSTEIAARLKAIHRELHSSDG